jgi:hypothetical protein
MRAFEPVLAPATFPLSQLPPARWDSKKAPYCWPGAPHHSVGRPARSGKNQRAVRVWRELGAFSKNPAIFLSFRLGFPICPASACEVASPEKAHARRAKRAQLGPLRRRGLLNRHPVHATIWYPKNSAIFSGSIKLRSTGRPRSDGRLRRAQSDVKPSLVPTTSRKLTRCELNANVRSYYNDGRK